MSPARLVTLVASLSAIVALTATTACDPFPDSCDAGAASCEGNTVVNCVSPGAEARYTEDRHDCGSDAVCFVASDSRGALCGRKAGTVAATCPTANEQMCNGTTGLATCVPSKAGGNVWVDETCSYPGYTCQPAPTPEYKDEYNYEYPTTFVCR